jgi:hypothetical protein
MALVGTRASAKLKLVGGGYVLAPHDYGGQRTLLQDFEDYCTQRQWPQVSVQTFSAHILEKGLTMGWPVIMGKTDRRRRTVIKGIRLATQPIWRGTEPTARRYERAAAQD